MRLPQNQEKKNEEKFGAWCAKFRFSKLQRGVRQEPKELICCCRDRAAQTIPQSRVPELFTGTIPKCEHSKCRKVQGHGVQGRSHNTAELGNSIKIHILWAKKQADESPRLFRRWLEAKIARHEKMRWKGVSSAALETSKTWEQHAQTINEQGHCKALCFTSTSQFDF